MFGELVRASTPRGALLELCRHSGLQALIPSVTTDARSRPVISSESTGGRRRDSAESQTWCKARQKHRYNTPNTFIFRSTTGSVVMSELSGHFCTANFYLPLGVDSAIHDRWDRLITNKLVRHRRIKIGCRSAGRLLTGGARRDQPGADGRSGVAPRVRRRPAPA